MHIRWGSNDPSFKTKKIQMLLMIIDRLAITERFNSHSRYSNDGENMRQGI